MKDPRESLSENAKKTYDMLQQKRAEEEEKRRLHELTQYERKYQNETQGKHLEFWGEIDNSKMSREGYNSLSFEDTTTFQTLTPEQQKRYYEGKERAFQEKIKEEERLELEKNVEEAEDFGADMEEELAAYNEEIEKQRIEKLRKAVSGPVKKSTEFSGIDVSVFGRKTTGNYEDTGEYTTVVGKDGLPMLMPVDQSPRSFKEAMGETVFSGGGGGNAEDLFLKEPVLSSESSETAKEQTSLERMDSSYNEKMQTNAADLQELQSLIMKSEQEGLQALGANSSNQQPVVNNITNSSAPSAPSSSGNAGSSSASDYFSRMKDDSISIPRWRSKIG